jgi:hypothetical protein
MENRMNEIDEIFEKMDSSQIDNEIRISIADLILKNIELKKESLGAWEKSFFAQSISNLATNITSSFQPTDSWLRLSLVNLEKALVPIEERNEEFAKRVNQVDSISYQMLVDATSSIKDGLA